MNYFLSLLSRYARQYLEENSDLLKPTSRFQKWKETTADEIKAFFALLLSMGLVHQQDLQDHWSLDPVLSTSSVMTRDRLLVLLTFLHCSDNNNYVPRGQEVYDPLYKLGTIYDTSRNLFSTNYYPTNNIAVDEGLVPWRGNIHFRVYNPDKPDKFGIKSYQLCDDRGYLWVYPRVTEYECQPWGVLDIGLCWTGGHGRAVG